MGEYSKYFKQTYKAPCGILVKGINAQSGLSWKGGEYSYEIGTPYIICPKKCANCQMRDEPFRGEGTGVLKLFCPVKPTDEPYIYENSYEAVLKMKDEEIARQKVSFKLSKQNRVCDLHTHYNVESCEWEFNYQPTTCAQGYCMAARGLECPVLGRKLSKEKGNVYYDLEIWGRDYTKDGTLFEGEQFHQVTKGIQLYDKPISLDIAKIIVKLEQDHIRFIARWNRRELDHMKAFKAERGEIDYHWAVKNIHAEKKLVRDFEQDMQDIQDGITVYHEFDEKRKKKTEKHEKREAAKEKRIAAIQKKILKEGWDNLDYTDKNRAYKLLDSEQIRELIAEHEKKLEEEKNQPQQTTLFDFMGG